MREQEEKVLNLCRELYRTAKDITMQTLWYEIGVMLENEPAVEHGVQADDCLQGGRHKFKVISAPSAQSRYLVQCEKCGHRR